MVATGRREERLAELTAEYPDRCYPLAFDITDRAATEEAFESLPAEWAELNVLLNNAGLALGLEPAHEARWDDWERMIDTNVTGLVFLTRLVLPGMAARKRGHIVNLGSIAGTYPYPGGNVYGATKAFVQQFSLNLRADLVGLPIRVTNLEPGLSETEFSVVRFGGDAERASRVYAGTEPIVADDIAELVFWCVTLPPHLNVNRLEVMATCQAFGPFAIHRQSD